MQAATTVSWQTLTIIVAVVALAGIGAFYPGLEYVAPTIAVLMVFLRSAFNGEQLKELRVEVNSRMTQLLESKARAAELEGHQAADRQHEARADAEIVRVGLADVAGRVDAAEVLRLAREDTAEVLRLARADTAEVLRVGREMPAAGPAGALKVDRVDAAVLKVERVEVPAVPLVPVPARCDVPGCSCKG